jgi:ferredoxin--NADP+ reductase
MYIQDKVEEYSDEVFDLLNNGAHIYFCGLKGMMPGASFDPPSPRSGH